MADDNNKNQQQEAPPSVDEIDLTQVSNYDAAAKKDKGLEEVAASTAKTSKSKRKKSGRFNFSEAELVPLPSKGRLYKEVTDDEDILDGYIRIFPMTAKEEEILSTQRHLRTGASTRLILENCIDSAIDAKDILVFDSNFLLFYLRKISYGDEYTFEITSNQDSLRRKFKHTVKISELRFEELDDDVQEPLKITLPKSKYTVECILPRMYHIEEIYKMNSRREKSTDSTDKRLLDNLLVTTVRILDNNKEEVPQKYWEEFFEALPGMDIAELREQTRFDTGVDELKGVVCPYTDREMDISIPMGPEFFRL